MQGSIFMYRERNPFEGLHGWISWPPGLLLTEAGLQNPGRQTPQGISFHPT